VARVAGVSVATISRVINKKAGVSELAAAKVAKAIEELDYQPSLLGKNLRRSHTKLVIVFIPTISNTFFSKVVLGMEAKAHENDYNIIICDTRSEKAIEHKYIELIRNRFVDGAIFLSSSLESAEMIKLSQNYPIVQCCEFNDDIDVPCVSIDNEKAAYEITKHLIKLGHKKIALITADDKLNASSMYHSARLREQGYKRALSESKIRANEEYIKRGKYNFKSGQLAMNELLELKSAPTAVFAVADTIAIGALKACRGKGLEVPKDVAIAGFDDISFSTMVEPPLTTIAQPQFDLGYKAMELLIERIGSGTPQRRKVILEHELVIRGTTF